MMAYKYSFGKGFRGATDDERRISRTIDIAEENPRLPEITPMSEAEKVLESWVDENYKDIIDTTEFLDSSRVKRVD